MPGPLTGTRVAALIAKGFEQVELFAPREALEAAGAAVDVVSPKLIPSAEGIALIGVTRSPSIGSSARRVPTTTTPCCYQAA